MRLTSRANGAPIVATSLCRCLKQQAEVISVAQKDPGYAMKLLKSETFAGPSDKARLICKVCRAALRRGMAREVSRCR